MAAFGTEIYNLLPNEAYMLVHLITLLLALWLAMGAYKMKKPVWGHFFVLLALAEVLHELTHLGITTLPFTHLMQQVFILVGLVLIAMDMKNK